MRWENVGRLAALLVAGLAIGLGSRGGDPSTPPRAESALVPGEPLSAPERSARGAAAAQRR
ncbi:MAG: hypothetical protein ACR2IN_06215, partial [Thermoleophilaceae bacterium]